VLGSSGNPSSLLGNFSLSGPVVRTPLAFSFSVNDSSNSDPVSIQATTPPAIQYDSGRISTRNHSLVTSSHLYFYGSEGWQLQVAYEDARFSADNLGRGGLNLAETAVNSGSSRREVRVSLSKIGHRFGCRGGVTVSENASAMNAESAAA